VLRVKNLFVGLLATLASAGASQAAEFEYIGEQIIPNAAVFDRTTIGGLSAIDYDPGGNRYFVLSDDRSDINAMRFYTFSLELEKFRRSSIPGMNGVSIDAVTIIQQPSGNPYIKGGADPEGLRYDAARHVLYWSNEGQRGLSRYQNPSVRGMDESGAYTRDFAVPAYYNPSGSADGRSSKDLGVYDNRGFESLAISPDGKTLWTATEEGLAQDSPQTGIEQGSKARILGFHIATGYPSVEYIYEVSPVPMHPILPGLFAMNGLADMLALADRQFLMLERAYAMGSGFSVRLFYADAREATDVSGVASINGRDLKMVRKKLVLDLAELRNDDGTPVAIDNLEGISFGPCYKGKPTLILVSDNNFTRLQVTQIIALSVLGDLPLPPNQCKADNPPR
jgi:hypothetical protein